MKPEIKRIFVSDLPETFTKEELENSFSKYGSVSSVEIKERKELTRNNTSLFFAYINLFTDELNLNQCFKDLSNKKWHGQFVQLQLARENFLERLKRERAEANQGTTNNTQIATVIKDVKPHISKQAPSSSSESDSDSEAEVALKPPLAASESESSDNEAEPEKKLPDSIHATDGDLIIKSNKSNILAPTGLKIPSFGKAPVAEVPMKKAKVKQNDSDANRKRLQHLKEMKQSYVNQKSLVQNALSYSNNNLANKKIVFDDEAPIKSVNGGVPNGLFDGEGEESDFEPDFEVKEQFQGEKGQKLLELQSRYKNDKRFALDRRFIEDEKEEVVKEEDDLEQEKEHQLKILNKILGRKESPKKPLRDSGTKRAMLKFDPTVPEHTSLELKITEPEKKKGKKEKPKEEGEKQGPEVSKEIFYKVPEKLKETLEEKQGFSLLSMFGRVEEDDKIEEETTDKELKRKPILNGQNPFKYDSSDDEDEIEDIPHKATSKIDNKKVDAGPVKINQSVFWTEPFFFKSDDFRLQEGFDFIEKIKSEDKEFGKIRRDLKGIVKAKIRNNERKNKMFKKKLGGSNKRRKHVRMKKALKR